MKRWCAVPVFLVLLSCRPAPAGPGQPPGVIVCGTEAVKATWPRILPAVNRCLAAAADGAWFDCLLGLIDPVAGVTEQVLACTVRSTKENMAAARAAGEPLAARSAARAEEFIEKRGYRFQ